jgi:hypothetical protein
MLNLNKIFSKPKVFFLVVSIFVLAILLEINNFHEPLKLNLTKINDKVLCIVLTSESSFINRSIPTWNHWAKKCDKTFFACNCGNLIKRFNSNERYALFPNNRAYKNALELPILQLNETIEHKKAMAGKVYKVIRKVYEEHGKEFRWFLLTDDDTFIFYQNLKSFISKQDSNNAVSYGYNFKVIVPGGFQSGGAGILFSHEALKRISNNIGKGICNQIKGHGDLAIGKCAYLSNVRIGISLDDYGRERFHPLSFPAHFNGYIPEWLKTYSSNDIKIGDECCSDETISFHYTSAEQMEFFGNMINQKLMKQIYNIF